MRNLLRQRRTELELTQQDVATAIGVALTTWCNWEKARACPAIANYAAIAAALNWQIADVQAAVREIELEILRRAA